MNVINKFKHWARVLIMLSKEEKIQPIIIPTDKENLLEGKVALVTGGSGGIGLAIAKAFYASGAKVIITGTNRNKLAQALDEITPDRTRANSIAFDITNVGEIEANISKASALFDENQIDILVNSAGVIGANDFWNTSEEEFDAVMNTNAKGTFFISRAVGKLMIERHIKGHILNVSSSAALRPAWTPYNMSKWAVKGLTVGLADMLLPYGIVVNAIAPGRTATPMLGKSSTDSDGIYEPHAPAKRYIMPEEIAALAVYMVSGAGDMVIGDTFYITGGSGIITLHN